MAELVRNERGPRSSDGSDDGSLKPPDSGAPLPENVQALDSRFNKYMLGNTRLKRLWTGARWAEGPVWFADLGLLVFSDVPNDRILKYDEKSGRVSVLRQPSGYANGNTRDREGRLITCCQDRRAVIRTEHDGAQTVLAGEFEGKRLNGPNDVVVKSDGTIWFTDSGYGLGSYYESEHQPAGEMIPKALYRFDPRSGTLDAVSKEHVRPNGLAFSPDEKKLYVCDSGLTDGPDKPTTITVYDIGEDGHLGNPQIFFDLRDLGAGASTTAREGGSGRRKERRNSALRGRAPMAGVLKYPIADGIRVDEDGNVWAGTGWGGPETNGVTVFAPDGAPIGRIYTPEIVANVAFGGAKRNRLFMAGGSSIYALHVNVAGAGFA
ncbi:MAG: SMP-30/gluconolactonase/LRE family protein [Bradyrhizobium sp.]